MASSDHLLAQILRAKLIPWTQNDLARRVLVATKRIPKKLPSSDIQITPTKLTGPRIADRSYGGKRWVIARWPQDALNEILQPRFICVLKGRMKFQINEYIVECEAGHILVIPSGVPHSNGARTCTAPGSTICELLYITPYPNAIHCWLDRFTDTCDTIEPLGNFMLQGEPLSTTYRLIVNEIMEQGNAASKITTSLMDALWAQMERALQTDKFLPVNATDKNYAQYFLHEPLAKQRNFTTTLKDYIYAHIHETITINDMATVMYLSRPQFTRKVRQETGCSFIEFLTRCRIEEAKLLLKGTTWSMTIIAQCIGIKPSYFPKVFFQQTGLTPSAFREQSKNDSIL